MLQSFLSTQVLLSSFVDEALRLLSAINRLLFFYYVNFSIRVKDTLQEKLESSILNQEPRVFLSHANHLKLFLPTDNFILEREQQTEKNPSSNCTMQSEKQNSLVSSKHLKCYVSIVHVRMKITIVVTEYSICCFVISC